MPLTQKLWLSSILGVVLDASPAILNRWFAQPSKNKLASKVAKTDLSIKSTPFGV
jgi:hypothetical protein